LASQANPYDPFEKGSQTWALICFFFKSYCGGQLQRKTRKKKNYEAQFENNPMLKDKT
jgi:hypothetical protein